MVKKSSMKPSAVSLIKHPEETSKFGIYSSTAALLFTNLLVIYFAVREDWSLVQIIWIYWLQSIIIGFFNFIRILTLKNFTTTNLKINKQPVNPSKGLQLFTAFFFAVHYGSFHFSYLFFLVAMSLTVKVPDFKLVLLSGLIFLLNHGYSFFSNLKSDSVREQNLGRVMFFPYARIIPMHLIILAGAVYWKGVEGLILFLLLKTLADLILHWVEHMGNSSGNSANKEMSK